MLIVLPVVQSLKVHPLLGRCTEAFRIFIIHIQHLESQDFEIDVLEIHKVLVKERETVISYIQGVVELNSLQLKLCRLLLLLLGHLHPEVICWISKSLDSWKLEMVLSEQ